MATPGKGTKRPTGELAKSNSKLAKFIAGGPNKLTPAQARTAAGMYRDMEKAAGKNGFSGFGSMDRSGVALGKAIKQTKAQTARADKAKQDAMKKKKGSALSKALRATPAGVGLDLAGKAAGMYVKAGKAVAGAIKDKVSPPKRGTMSGKQLFPGQKKGGAKPRNLGPRKELTPAQLAKLKKMLDGRLNK